MTVKVDTEIIVMHYYKHTHHFRLQFGCIYILEFTVVIHTYMSEYIIQTNVHTHVHVYIL